MLCSGCRRQLTRGAAFCEHCGATRKGASAPLELVLPDGRRIAAAEGMTLGRAPDSTIQLPDPTVSRTHARIGPGPTIEDAGSSAGTFVDDAPVSGPVALHDGAQLRLGTQTIAVERSRAESEAGRTIVVQTGASLALAAVDPAAIGHRPRVRSGYALKRLEAGDSKDGKRFVLRDLRTDKFLRLSEADADLFGQLDGTRTLIDVITYAESQYGQTGSARAARLLADLGDRGFLAGVASADGVQPPKAGRLKRWMGPHVKDFRGFGDRFERLYEHGGWLLFTRPALITIAAIIVAGLAAFVYLVAGRYGTPFVVADKIGLGGLVFLFGRFAFAAVHETAHGLAMASFGRRIDRAGFKFFFILPYAFVDTSEAWFEPRRRRMAISAAGPISDFALGGLFAILSFAVDGTLREVFFQLAFSAYIGALFNLNPTLDRDGYHIMVDLLREPGLKARAKEQFDRRLRGGKRETDDLALRRYTLAGFAWTVFGAGFAISMSLRYEDVLVTLAPKPVVYTVMATIWIALFIPVLWAVGKPLFQRVFA